MTRLADHGSVAARTRWAANGPAIRTTNTTFRILPVVRLTPRNWWNSAGYPLRTTNTTDTTGIGLHTHARACARAARESTVVSVVSVVCNEYIYIYLYLNGRLTDYRRTTKTGRCSPAPAQLERHGSGSSSDQAAARGQAQGATAPRPGGRRDADALGARRAATAQGAPGRSARLPRWRHVGAWPVSRVRSDPVDGFRAAAAGPIGDGRPLKTLSFIRCVLGETHKPRATPRARPGRTLHNASYAALTGYHMAESGRLERARGRRPAPRAPATRQRRPPRPPPGAAPHRGALAHTMRPSAGKKNRKKVARPDAGGGCSRPIAMGAVDGAQ
jgi:hypothetical protein